MGIMETFLVVKKGSDSIPTDSLLSVSLLKYGREVTLSAETKVEEEKEKLAKYRQMLENVEASLSS